MDETPLFSTAARAEIASIVRSVLVEHESLSTLRSQSKLPPPIRPSRTPAPDELKQVIGQLQSRPEWIGYATVERLSVAVSAMLGFGSVDDVVTHCVLYARRHQRPDGFPAAYHLVVDEHGPAHMALEFIYGTSGLEAPAANPQQLPRATDAATALAYAQEGRPISGDPPCGADELARRQSWFSPKANLHPDWASMRATNPDLFTVLVKGQGFLPGTSGLAQAHGLPCPAETPLAGYVASHGG